MRSIPGQQGFDGRRETVGVGDCHADEPGASDARRADDQLIAEEREIATFFDDIAGFAKRLLPRLADGRPNPHYLPPDALSLEEWILICEHFEEASRWVESVSGGRPTTPVGADGFDGDETKVRRARLAYDRLRAQELLIATMGEYVMGFARRLQPALADGRPNPHYLPPAALTLEQWLMLGEHLEQIRRSRETDSSRSTSHYGINDIQRLVTTLGGPS